MNDLEMNNNTFESIKHVDEKKENFGMQDNCKKY